MRIKIIATVLICFYSGLSFSQTKKLLHSFKRHFEILPRNNGSCWTMSFREGKEDYNINLFSDSTFVIAYSKTGNLYPGYEKNEVTSGKFFKKDDSIYLIRNAVVGKFSKNPDPCILEQVFNIDTPLRIEYSGDSLLVYNSAGPFLIFRKEEINLLNNYKNSKPATYFSPVTAISPQFSNNPISF